MMAEAGAHQHADGSGSGQRDLGRREHDVQLTATDANRDLARVSTRRLVDPALKSVDTAVETALLSFNEDGRSLPAVVKLQLILLLGSIKKLRTKQTEVVLSSGPDTAKAAMHGSSKGILGAGLLFLAMLGGIPRSMKVVDGVETGWYIACLSIALGLLMANLIVFWRRFFLRTRFVASVKSVPPWLILGYSLLLWSVQMAYPDTGKDVTDRIGATFFLTVFILMLTLDTCDCSRRFHVAAFTVAFAGTVYGAVMASFFYPDVVIRNGTDTGNGRQYGRITKNGLYMTSELSIMSIMAPAMVTAFLDNDHTSCYLLTNFMPKADLLLVDEQQDRLVEPALKVVEEAVQAALLSCVGNNQKLVLVAAVMKMLRVKQKEVVRSNGNNTAEAAMDWPSWGIAISGLLLFASGAIPASVKTGAGWYVALHSIILSMVVFCLGFFWHRFLERERLVFTLKSGLPLIILGYALLQWVVDVAYPSVGLEITDRIAATTVLLACVLILTLDACDCSRRFHVTAFTIMFFGTFFKAVLASFVWPDLVVHSGQLTDRGWVGSFSKNGLLKSSYWGMLGLITPALVTALRDSDHHSCYLLTDFLFKADLVADDY